MEFLFDLNLTNSRIRIDDVERPDPKNKPRKLKHSFNEKTANKFDTTYAIEVYKKLVFSPWSGKTIFGRNHGSLKSKDKLYW